MLMWRHKGGPRGQGEALAVIGVCGVVEATETTLSAAVERGMLDERLHAAPMEALRALADRVDTCDPSKDNVSLPTFLKYLDALNLLPEKPTAKAERASVEEPKSNLEKFRAKYPYRLNIASA
jgi:hypothetical protein